MKILCTTSKLGTALLFLVCLHSSHRPSSSPCPTSSGSNVSQDYTSRIKLHNKLFWAGNVQEIYFGKSYEKQRRTADVSNGQTFRVWPWVCTLAQSLDNILQHCAKGNNGSFDPTAVLQTLRKPTQIPSNIIFIQRHPRISLFSVPGSPWQ